VGQPELAQDKPAPIVVAVVGRSGFITSRDARLTEAGGSTYGAGFSASTGEIPQVPVSGHGTPSKIRGFPNVDQLLRLAQLLPLEVTSINVFRAALVLVVLTLAIGQDAGLLCKIWCPDATSTACPHHESTTSPSVRADDTCTNGAVAAVAFVREDGRRTVPAPDAQNALVVLRFRFVTPPTDPRPGYESGRRLLLEERPLVTALRI
jgi:hypothetical protein